VRKLNERSACSPRCARSARRDAVRSVAVGNLDELADWFDGAARRSRPGELAAQLALLSHADKDDAGNQVRLMSLHAAKGLEFRYVFIVGVEDGTLPHEASLEEGRLDEERRLMYVGITRAKEQLWLSLCAEAQRWGDKLRLEAQPLPR
jgi:ATP-dependent DNA helicase Rep